MQLLQQQQTREHIDGDIALSPHVRAENRYEDLLVQKRENIRCKGGGPGLVQCLFLRFREPFQSGIQPKLFIGVFR